MTAPTLTRPAARPWTTDLRTLLRVDAVLCAATGVVALTAATAVADVLGPDVPTSAVRAVGLALVVWAVDVALLSRARGRLLRRGAVAVAAVNVAWEVATRLVVAGAFSLGGGVLALAVAAVVGGLGLLQLRAVRG
jgi:hypothetical protein